MSEDSKKKFCTHNDDASITIDAGALTSDLEKDLLDKIQSIDLSTAKAIVIMGKEKLGLEYEDPEDIADMVESDFRELTSEIFQYFPEEVLRLIYSREEE